MRIFLLDSKLEVGGVLLVSSINKTDHHDITEILLKVALNTITVTLTSFTTYYQRVSFGLITSCSREVFFNI